MIGPEIELELSSGVPSRELSWQNCDETSAGTPDFSGGNDTALPRVREAGELSRRDVARAELAAAPWWLWWNILSLDAPMVAVAWALVFAKSAGVLLPGAEVGALGLVVWLIYTVDRLLDGQLDAGADRAPLAAKDTGGAFGSALRQRHIFHRVHARGVALATAGVAALTAILVSTQIGEHVLRPAVPLAFILVLYMAWVHLGRGRVLAKLPKEVAVGGVFAAGVVLPAWARIETREWEFCLLAMLFAAVCTLNCVAIEEWERVRGRHRDVRAGGARFVTAGLVSGRFAAAIAVCAALLTPIVHLRGEFSAIGAAIAVSAVFILILDLVRERISADALRVLVDVALLLPALVVLAFR